MSGKSSPLNGSFEVIDFYNTHKIQTKSIEATLLPLVSQITCLIKVRDVQFLSEKAAETLQQVGRMVAKAVDKFVVVGESVAEENAEIRTEMLEACRMAKTAGNRIEHYTEVHAIQENQFASGDKNELVCASRVLLSAVTRVLLLADRVMIRNLLLAKERVVHILLLLEGASNFADFMNLFAQFGQRMVSLGTLSGDRLKDLKSDRVRTHMIHRRSLLEKSTALLLASTKTYLRHPDSQVALKLRNEVLAHMRCALKNIESLVTRGVPSGGSAVPSGLQQAPSQQQAPVLLAAVDLSPLGNESDSGIGLGHQQATAFRAIRQLEELIDLTRVTMQVTSATESKIAALMDTLFECCQEFTDSPYTSHEDREQILHLGIRLRKELGCLLRLGSTSSKDTEDNGTNLDACIVKCRQFCGQLREQLQITCQVLAEAAVRPREDNDVLLALKLSACAGDAAQSQEHSRRLEEQANRAAEACKLLRHTVEVNATITGGSVVSMSGSAYGSGLLGVSGEVLVAQAELLEAHCRTSAVMLLLASRVATQVGVTSRVARESLAVFSDAWTAVLNDVATLLHDVHEFRQGSYLNTSMTPPLAAADASRINFSSWPVELSSSESLTSTSGCRHGLSSRSCNETPVLDPETVAILTIESEMEQARIEKLGLEMKSISSEMELEAAKWSEPNNDIVKRARIMSSFAYSMYLFTKGEGTLKTTHDLFQQAEKFADSGVKLYRTVQDFLQRLPPNTSAELESLLSPLPAACHALQQAVIRPATSHDQTASKSAVFNKVDDVIKGTRDTMQLVSRLVTTCFVMANQHSIDYRQMSVQSPLPFALVSGASRSPFSWSPHPESFNKLGHSVGRIQSPSPLTLSCHESSSIPKKQPLLRSNSVGKSGIIRTSPLATMTDVMHHQQHQRELQRRDLISRSLSNS